MESESRRRGLKFVILIGGAAAAMWFGSKAPREQHVRFVLGEAAATVTGLEADYVDASGDVAQGVRLSFAPGTAPRIVAHNPALSDGPYGVHVELDTREGRRVVQRQVTLGGSTTSVDLAAALRPTP